MPTADGPAVAARVRAPPEDGAANAALIRLLAGWLDVPQTSVRATAGSKGRIKSLAIDGDQNRMAALIAGKLKPSPAQ